MLTGGKAHSLGGTWWEPTVLTEVRNDMVIHREEVFGPVAPLFRFKTEEEAIKMANDTEFGEDFRSIFPSFFFSRQNDPKDGYKKTHTFVSLSVFMSPRCLCFGSLGDEHHMRKHIIDI